MRYVILIVVLVLWSACASDDTTSAPDAVVFDDAAPADAAAVLPRCADVGCPTVAFCNVDGCCRCNASGISVECLAAAAPPDACDPP